MPTAEPLLHLVNVTKEYAGPRLARESAGVVGNTVRVLKGISLEVNPGEALAIVGPSGSGKSTLLHIIGTLDTVTTGEVRLAGRDISRLNELELAAVRNRELGFVFQSHFLLPQCTVLENVLVPTLVQPRSAGGPSEPAENRAERLLTRVGLEARLDHRPGELSGGERQRVAVVRALINCPQLLLADEPTGSLDQALALQLWELLLELNREERVTLIAVTHAPELAMRMERVLELKSGQLRPLQPDATRT